MEYLFIGLAVAVLLFGLVFYNAKKAEGWNRDNESHLSDTANWYGPFYVNKNDKRIFLQKRKAGGYTINFGNPIGIAITVIFFGLLIWILYLES